MDDKIEQAILNLLEKDCLTSTTIVEKIKKKKIDCNTERTIRRRLANLAKDKEIFIVHPKNYLDYGITQGKGNESYYASKDFKRNVQYIVKILEDLTNGDLKEKDAALKEIENIQEIQLNSIKLERFLILIETVKDEKFLVNLIRVLFLYNLQKGIIPNNIENILDLIEKKLDEQVIETELGYYYLTVLAFMKRKSSIKWLKYLIKNDKLAGRVFVTWTTPLVAKIVEDNKTDLYDFGKGLNTNQKKILAEVRTYANRNIKLVRK